MDVRALHSTPPAVAPCQADRTVYRPRRPQESPLYRLVEDHFETLVRGHWAIENRSHWARDVTFDEDRSQLRRGAAPRMMAILRNLAITIIRLLGVRYIPQGQRRFGCRTPLALAVLGM